MDTFGQIQTNFVLVMRERVLSSNLEYVLGKLNDIFKLKKKNTVPKST